MGKFSEQVWGDSAERRQWIEQWHHDITPVAELPLPRDLEHPPCMVDRRLRILHRLVRQLAPDSEPRSCCSYHGQDWGAASETAIRLLEVAKAKGSADKTPPNA